MKRGITILAILAAGLVAFLLVIWYGFGVGRILEGDLTAAFGHDLRQFVFEHHGTVPHDWKEFELWEKQRTGRNRWPATGSEERFELVARPYQLIDKVPFVVRVKKESLKGMETFINYEVASAWIELGMTNNWTNN